MCWDNSIGGSLMKQKIPYRGPTTSGLISAVLCIFFLASMAQAGTTIKQFSQDENVATAATEQFIMDTTNGILVAETNQLFNQNDVGVQWIVSATKGDTNSDTCMVSSSFMSANTISGQNANLASRKTIIKKNIAGVADPVKLNIEAVAQITTKTSVVPADVLAIRNDNPLLDLGISAAGINSFNDTDALRNSQSSTHGRLGGGPLKTSLALLTGADEGGGMFTGLWISGNNNDGRDTKILG